MCLRDSFEFDDLFQGFVTKCVDPQEIYAFFVYIAFVRENRRVLDLKTRCFRPKDAISVEIRRRSAAETRLQTCVRSYRSASLWTKSRHNHVVAAVNLGVRTLKT